MKKTIFLFLTSIKLFSFEVIYVPIDEPQLLAIQDTATANVGIIETQVNKGKEIVK